jgi:hypothetical protein
MVAYEFYLRDPIKGNQFIGLLPERRKNPASITKESIIRWGEKYFGKDLDTKDIFFIRVTIDENTVRISRPVPFTITQKDV